MYIHTSYRSHPTRKRDTIHACIRAASRVSPSPWFSTWHLVPVPERLLARILPSDLPRASVCLALGLGSLQNDATSPWPASPLCFLLLLLLLFLFPFSFSLTPLLNPQLLSLLFQLPLGGPPGPVYQVEYVSFPRRCFFHARRAFSIPSKPCRPRRPCLFSLLSNNRLLCLCRPRVQPPRTMWRRTYLLLALIRLWFALSPSYLHPDENFQGPEVIAGMPASPLYLARACWLSACVIAQTSPANQKTALRFFSPVLSAD